MNITTDMSEKLAIVVARLQEKMLNVEEKVDDLKTEMNKNLNEIKTMFREHLNNSERQIQLAEDRFAPKWIKWVVITLCAIIALILIGDPPTLSDLLNKFLK